MKKNSSSQIQQKNPLRIPQGVVQTGLTQTRNVVGLPSSVMNQRNNSQNQTQTNFSKSASKKQAFNGQYQSPNILFGVKLQENQSQQQLPMAQMYLGNEHQLSYQGILPIQKKVQKSKNFIQNQQKYIQTKNQVVQQQQQIKSRNYLIQPSDVVASGSRTQIVQQGNKTGGQTQFQTQTQMLQNRSNSQQSTKSAIAAMGIKKKNLDYDLTCYNDIEEPKQTLYTNISLRELSSSPDREPNAGQNRKSKKIMITNNALPRNGSQDSSGEDFQHRPLQPLRGENGAILNIKTVQDINIYNNSFIVNTNGQGGFQQQQIQNIIQEHQTQTKKGLKLRKDLSGVSTGFGQSRSASQGRAAVNKNSFTDNNSYGRIKTDNIQNAYLQSSSSSNVINHVMSHQNMQNLAKNPNQKRIISNASGKLFGNLAAITSMTKTTGHGQKQILQNVYQNDQQTLKKILSNKLSSNTSRLQSRTDSRNMNATSIERNQNSSALMNMNDIQGAESTPNLTKIEPLYQNVIKQNNGYEVRKKSLQEMKKTSNKFRNQINQLSSENIEETQGQTNQSVNVKKDQYFQNRNGIVNRIKTQDAAPNNKLDQNNEIEQNIQNLCQQWSIIQNQISKEENTEAQIRQNLKKLTQFNENIKNGFNVLQKVQLTNLVPEKQLENLSQEVNIMIAYCMVDLEQNHEAIKNLDKICSKQAIIQILSRKTDVEKKNLKNALLLKSIIQRKIGDHEKALETISNCINNFPEFKNGYLIRGQTYLLMNKCQRAHQDFIKFDQLISPQEDIFQTCIAKESLGDAYKKMKKYKQAAISYNEAIKNLREIKNEKTTYFERKIKMKIAMCVYYQGNMQESIGLFKQIILYYKSYNKDEIKVQQKLIKCNYYNAKAILSLSAKNGDGDSSYQTSLMNLQYCCNDEIDPELHELYCGNATFEIAKIFLRQKDILNAYEFMQRATDNNFNSKRLSLYRDFAEGVVQLMKRKIKKGVQILTDLLEILINGQKEIEKSNKERSTSKLKNRYNPEGTESDAPETNLSTLNGKANQIASGKFNKSMYDYLIFNIYIYRSYGYVAIEKYEHALQDIAKAKLISPHTIVKATIYNKWMSRGILKMDTEEYLMASKYFGKASLRFPENKDSFCLNAISIVRSYSYSMADQFIDDLQKQQKVEQTLEFMNVAIHCCCQEQRQASLYFFRGLLHFQLHNFYESIQDFNIAIREEEEASGQFHLARGRAFACLSILDEALKDLSIALELDETLHEAYIFRGKCAYLLGDNNLAFHDFQKLIMSDQKNPVVHIYAGNLLMTTGAYLDAIKAFDNADTVQQTALASFQRIRCYCALSDLEKAFEQMQLCLHLAPNEKFAQYDYKVFLPLLSCVRSFEFSKNDKGEKDTEGEQEQTQIIKNCVLQISSIIEIFEKDEQNQLKKGQSKMSIQIIPNVKRIKLEKNIFIKNVTKMGKNQELADLTKEQRQSLKKETNYGYYRENIFQLEEMYLYRSIFHTYIGNYDEAISDLNKSWKQHFRSKNQSKTEDEKQVISPMSSKSQLSQATDLSDIGLCSINVREYNYNMIINLIQQNEWEESLKKITDELTQAPSSAEQARNVKQLHLVRAMVYQEMGNTEKYNSDLTVYLKNFKKIYKNSQNAVIIEPFEVKGRLCQYFDPIEMKFSAPKSKSGFAVWMRPSFSMPFIKPPNMIPNIDEQVIQSEFNLKQIDAPMPEAPWVRQCTLQNFEPFNYLVETQDQKKEGKNLGSQSKHLTQKYLNKYLIYDEKVIEDIDDLSDTSKVSLISEIEINENSNSPKNELGLKEINKINQSKVTKTQNGVSIKSIKYKCGRSQSCGSCHVDPINNESRNISNQDLLIKALKMTKTERRIVGSQDKWSEDTVSNEEYGTSSEEEPEEKKPSYSHSRFSSNMGDLEDLENLMTPNGEIDQIDLQIDGPSEKKLKNDKRQIQNHGKSEVKKEENFMKKIDSIQILESPIKQINLEERESLVLLGSKNFDKNQPKKKSKKIGGTGNLKKNKLAIAFNNLENGAAEDED